MARKTIIVTVYLLGEGYILGPDGERISNFADLVYYTPGCEGGDFYLGDSEAHVGGGTFLRADQALQPQWSRHLETSGALWLVPLLQRMAGGEAVEPSEVFEAYRNVHNKRPRPQKWEMSAGR